MRLSPAEIVSIKQAVARIAGPRARLHLFGSRVEDTRRGGDIDLLLELDEPVDHAAWLGSCVEAAIIRLLGDRKVDVLLSAPNLADSAVHEAARSTRQAL